MRDFGNWQNTVRGLVIGVVAAICSAPFLYYMAYVAVKIKRDLSDALLMNLFLSQLALVLVLCVICATCGTAWSRKYGLPGWFDRERFSRFWWVLAIIVVGGTVASYFKLNYTVKSIPEFSNFLPKSMWIGLAIQASGAVTEEIVFRYGIMTLIQRLIKKMHWSIFLAAFFYAAIGIKTFNFLEVGPNVGIAGLVFFASRFINAYISGYIYGYFGLAPAMICRALIGSSYFVWVMIG